MGNTSFYTSSGTTASVENSISTKVAAAEAAKVAAQAAQTAAETSATNAQTAADSVESVAADAAAASSYASDAQTYKNAAETAKTAAETAQAAAETAQTGAETAETNASTSATSASSSATLASTSATSASTSASSASTSATSASSSATSASTSASNASTSETNAATSETNAAASATAAASSATAAAASETAAATSETNAATSESNASTSATNASTSATAAAASQTAAAASAASAASAFDSFDDRYLGTFTTAAEPTVDNDGDALVTGALYFNSTEGEMRVYDGAQWIVASAATEASLLMYEYTATAGQTTFSGADDNGATLSYTIDNIIVTLNGVVLDPSDYTATSGTSIVLASGAALNDELNVVAFKSFTTADMVSATNGGTFGNSITVTGTVTATSFSGNGSNLTNLTSANLTGALPAIDGSSLTGISTDLVNDTTPQLGGDLQSNGNDVVFADNDKAIFGAGSDLEIYHDGSNSRIVDAGTGNLNLQADNNINILNNAGTEFKAQFITGGAVNLFHANAKKFETTSTGVDVTGTVTATAFSGDGSGLTGVGGSTSAGAVGTYGLFYIHDNASTRNFGYVQAGSGLYPVNVYGQTQAVAQSGSWRLMGKITGSNTQARSSVFVRIS